MMIDGAEYLFAYLSEDGKAITFTVQELPILILLWQ